MSVDCSKLRSCYKIKTYKNSKEIYQIKLQEQASNQANKQTHKLAIIQEEKEKDILKT